ncbi:MAG TPA: hypothetical protein VKZ59_16815, partial [Acidobacteriota bacterium]|nr:hypothetical protein [Acidobacteriota bacterium]
SVALGNGAYESDGVAADTNVGREAGISRAVNHLTATDDQIVGLRGGLAAASKDNCTCKEQADNADVFHEDASR